MRKVGSLGCVGLLLASSAAWAGQGMAWHGDVGVERGYTSARLERAMTRLDANLSGEYQSEPCSAKMAVRWRADEQLSPTRQHSAELRDAFFECRKGDWLLKLGRQVIVWGKADNFRVLDAVHPFDYREFLLDAKESARRPLTMAKVERKLGERDALQLLLITERRGDILPQPGARFAELFPQATLERLATPSSHTHGAQVGMKWEHTSQQVGYTLNLLDRWSPQDRYVFAPRSATWAREPYRQLMLGGSADVALGAWVVRGEAMLTPRVFLPGDGATPGGPPVYLRYRQSAWVAGVDRSIGELFTSAQLFETRISGGDVAPMGDRTQRLMSLSASHPFLQDQLQARLFVARDLRHGATWFSMSVEHAFPSGWELNAGADLFEGASASAFGRIRQQSRIKIGMKFRL